MKRFLKQVVSIVLLMTLMVGAIGSVHAESSALTDEQKNAIAMLNHLTVLTQETNAAKNSRMFMEQAYASLINNTYPNAVDSRTLSQMTGLLDTMEKYRMVNVKRDRLQFIYEQNQAKAIRAAVPNPLGLLSSVHSLTPARLIASVVYMAVDSYTSYTAYTAENDLQFLESNQKIYQSYGGYWLILADAYYNNGEFKNCLEAVATYEAMGTRLFRWDYEYAKVLPLAIASAEQVYSEEEYAEYAAKRADAIYENTQNKDWALRYFAAQTYVDVYGKTSDKAYLQKAYSIVLDNVNYLVKEQQTMNETYLAKVKETAVPKDATNSQKDQINNYNKMLKENRKTEFAPVSEALYLNCELLFGLAGELQISDADKTKVDTILHPNGNRLFLNEALDDQFWFNTANKAATEPADMEFGGTGMVLPVRLLSPNATITVSVKEKNADEAVILTDWKLDKVERGTEGDISTYVAIYNSEEGKNHVWEPESTILIDIVPNPDASEEPIHFEYTAEGSKKEWYDYLKVWEGHKNNWYDYLKVWDNSVNFIRVN